MLNEQILSYVRDNLQAGFARADVEAALRASGWDALDIAAAFSAVAGVPAPIPNRPKMNITPVTQEQRAMDAEVARIQKEIKGPAKKQAAVQGGESGIIGFMIRNKLASSKQVANVTLIICALLFVGLAAWLVMR